MSASHPVAAEGVEIHSDLVCTLGECPLWDEWEGALFWIDSLAPRLYRLGPSGELRSWTAPQDIGSFALCESGGAVCALRDGIYRLDFESGAFRLHAATPNDPERTRLNDGKCDRRGRFWFGSMIDGQGAPDAALYCLDEGAAVHEVCQGIHVSNGLAFPENSSAFYHSNSRTGEVFRMEPAAQDSIACKRTPFFRTDPAVERPDGAAVDAEGHYWSALYGGAAVVRISPEGKLVQRIELPTDYPTMPAFGGADLRTLFITTARAGLHERPPPRDPFAGKLLSVRVEVPGVIEPRYRG